MKRTVTVAIGPADDVADILKRLRSSLSAGESIVLRVVLLPPLVQLRRLELPRMAAEDARRAVARNVGRYFPDVREPQTVAVQPLRDAWMAALAPAAITTAIYDAAREAGWDVDAVVPAHALWAAAARDGMVAVSSPTETTVLEVQRGALLSIRRFRPGSTLTPELAAARVLPAEPTPQVRSAAANFDLVPDAVRALRVQSARRATAALVAASAVFLVMAAAATLLGEQRELAALQERRAEIRPQVVRALAGRDTLLETTERLNTIARLEQSSERWSSVIANVAEALPMDASLSAFRAEADSVSLEGQAQNAAGVFAAMRSAPGLLAVRASSPVRQEGGAGQPVVERFSMAARLGREAAP